MCGTGYASGMRVILITTLLFLSAGYAVADDSGSSQNLILRVGLPNDLYLGSRSNLATKDWIREDAIQYADLTLGVRLSPEWSADAGFRRARIRLPGRWRNENRPLINVNWRDTLDGYKVYNRMRMEYRSFEDQAEDRFRFRNEVRVIAPWKLPAVPGRLFVEEEAFYELNDSGFNMHWLTTGLRFKIADGTFFKVGYRWQESKFGDEWSTRHVAVTGLLMFL